MSHKIDRKTFLRQAGMGGALLLAGQFPLQSLAGRKKADGDGIVQRLTILHTNDVHSRLEPFGADGGKYAGQGGVAERAALIRKIRQEEEHVLLVDCGDIFQGTPYFNLYKGEPEIKAMSMMGYEAATMGNHDFDAGVEGFANQLPHANFPILVANYDFTGTAMEGKTKPYQVFQKGELRIGVFGLGIQLKGLVPADSFGKTEYEDPVWTARKMVDILRKKERCDLVVCISHLGYEYSHGKISDRWLARDTWGIDLILGGHTHTFLDEPVTVPNQKGYPVAINQVGWGGVRLGRIDYEFYADRRLWMRRGGAVRVERTNLW